jgi:hypothetical protein
MSNELRLWVDVVWLNDRPLGLGAKRLIALMQDIAGLEAPAAEVILCYFCFFRGPSCVC